MHPYRTATSLHSYRCEIDLGLTYALRRPKLARRCFDRAVAIARELLRPDLTYSARELRGIVG